MDGGAEIAHLGVECHAALTGDDPEPLLEQIIESPTMLRYGTQHRRHTLACACNLALTTPVVRAAANGSGPKLTAVAAYLSGVGRLGNRAIRTLFADVFDIPISLGAVSKHEAVVIRALEPIHAEAHTQAQGLDANVDETGWRQGTAKAWLWVAVTKLLTAFLIRPNRNRQAFDDLAGPQPGVLMTDRYSVYTHLEGERRQECWAQLRRNFQAMIDRQNGGSVIGEDLLVHAGNVWLHWQKVQVGTRSRRWFHRTQAVWLRREVRLLLERGRACGCVKTASVCREILAVESSLWTFAFGRVWSRRTTRRSGRCVMRCVGGRRATARTASGAASSWSGC